MGYSHLYVTAHGKFTTSPWVGESAQIGFRVSKWAFNNPSPRITLPNITDAREVFEEETSAKFQILRTFKSDDDRSLAYAPVMDDIAADVDVFLNAIKAKQWSGFRWTDIKIAALEYGTGKYLYPASVYTYLSPVIGGAAGPLPPEVALAISTRAQVVGKRGRGRVYVPALASSVLDGSGTVDSTTRTQWVTAMKALHDGLANLPGIDTFNCGLVICSANDGSAIVPREVRIGNHFDVQRRRQHQVDETYTSLPVG